MDITKSRRNLSLHVLLRLSLYDIKNQILNILFNSNKLIRKTKKDRAAPQMPNRGTHEQDTSPVHNAHLVRAWCQST